MLRAVLEFVSGTRKGQKVVLPADHSVSIGRLNWSELVCDDERMSKIHFHLKTDPHGCYLQDRSSRNGTFVNGLRVADCILRDGDTILAGDTVFQIRIEGGNLESALKSLPGGSWVRTDIPEEEKLAANGKLAVPFTVETCDSGLTLCRGAIEQISPGSLAKILSESAQSKLHLHLLIDFNRLGVPCPAEVVAPNYLFDWLAPPAAALASPVVVLPVELETWRMVVNEGWGMDGIICLFSSLPPAEVLAHLRDSCRAKGPNGARNRQGMFGYCWPTVLATILAQSPRDQVDRLMTGIDAILIEFPDLPDNWQLFGHENLPKILGKLGFVHSDGSVPEKAKIKTEPPRPKMVR